MGVLTEENLKEEQQVFEVLVKHGRPFTDGAKFSFLQGSTGLDRSTLLNTLARLEAKGQAIRRNTGKLGLRFYVSARYV